MKISVGGDYRGNRSHLSNFHKLHQESLFLSIQWNCNKWTLLKPLNAPQTMTSKQLHLEDGVK